ncbi:MAG TPA: DUF222 domain-containing protein [Streptosporangiaceae bacterium]
MADSDAGRGLSWSFDLDLAELLTSAQESSSSASAAASSPEHRACRDCPPGLDPAVWADQERQLAEERELIEAAAAAGAEPRDLAAVIADRVPAGPGLAAWLSQADPGQCSDWDLPGVAAAFRRVASWAQAGELAAVAAISSRAAARDDKVGVDEDGRPARVSPGAAAEVSLGLVMSQTAASWWADLAVDLRWKLQATWGALSAGNIDLSRARMIAEALAGLGDDVARLVEKQVLPKAGQQTPGQLRGALRRLIITADPDGADERRKNAERQAQVSLYPDHEGTATLVGSSLPGVHAAAAMSRITALAHALKATGAGGGIDLLRAQVFLGLLLGTLPLIPPPPDAPPDPPLHDSPDPRSGGSAADQHPGAKPTRRSPPDRDPACCSGHSHQTGRPKTSPAGGFPLEPDPPRADLTLLEAPASRSALPLTPEGTSAPGSPPANLQLPWPLPPARPCSGPPPDLPPPDPLPSVTPASEATPSDPPPPRGFADEADDGVELPWVPLPGTVAQRPPVYGSPPSPDRRPPGQLDLTIPWTVLTGQATSPAQLSRLGPITAAQALPLARLAALDPHASWRVILTSPAGHAMAVERVRRLSPGRPGDTSRPAATGRAAGVTGRVTVTIPAVALGRPPRQSAQPGSAAVAETRPKEVQAEEVRTEGQDEGIRAAILRAARRAAARAEQASTADSAAPGGCAHSNASGAYRPSPRLRELIDARDQTCRQPRCRQPARQSDLDHTVPYDQGGRTCSCNLGAYCRTHHQIKQQPGWQVTQPQPGVFHLTTPAGRTYAAGPDIHLA